MIMIKEADTSMIRIQFSNGRILDVKKDVAKEIIEKGEFVKERKHMPLEVEKKELFEKRGFSVPIFQEDVMMLSEDATPLILAGKNIPKWCKIERNENIYGGSFDFIFSWTQYTEKVSLVEIRDLFKASLPENLTPMEKLIEERKFLQEWDVAIDKDMIELGG